jgi:beta-glucosidase
MLCNPICEDVMSFDPQPLYRNPRLSIEQHMADLLRRMTLEEKIAQMSVLDQVDEAISRDADPDRLKAAFQHGVGAVSRLGLHRTPRDTALIYNRIQRFLIEHTRCCRSSTRSWQVASNRACSIS